MVTIIVETTFLGHERIRFSPDQLPEVAERVARQPPDEPLYVTNGSLGILVQPYLTRRVQRVLVDAAGAVSRATKGSS